MDSLFVISLPRSLSSFIYQLASKAIGLRQPSWVSDGEIMNLDRFALYPGPNFDTSSKFVARHTNPKLFKAATDFLDQVAMRSGFAYKDVVNPFVVSEWLKSNKFCVLRIKRNIADIAYSMLEKGWHYPSVASHSQGDLTTSVIEGLLRANQALDLVPGEDLNYDDFIYDEASIMTALSRLYPLREIEEIKYLNRSFSHVRDRILERRTTNIYKRLHEIVAERTLLL
jgi:hypothetical protein